MKTSWLLLALLPLALDAQQVLTGKRFGSVAVYADDTEANSKCVMTAGVCDIGKWYMHEPTKLMRVVTTTPGVFVAWPGTVGGPGVGDVTGGPSLTTDGSLVKVAASDGELEEAGWADVVAAWMSCASGYLKFDGTCDTPAGGAGDVTGPAASDVGESVAFGGTDGKSIIRTRIDFNGPATTTKQFNLPNANATILTDNALVTVPQGGTGVGGLTGVLLGNGTSAFSVVTGTASDCVKVDGTSGSCGAVGGDVSGGSTSVDGELAAYNATTGKIIKQSFVKFTGPATSVKTYTLPNSSQVILTDAAAVTVAQGGTGLSSGTSGGVPFFSATNAMASSALLATSTLVLGGGAGAAPTTAAGYTVQAVGTAGTAVTNAGTATSIARSDHTHLVPWKIGMQFQATPSTGLDTTHLPIDPACGGSISVDTIVISANTKGTAFTFNVQRFTSALASVGNLFSSTQTYNTAGDNLQSFTTNQNNTNVTQSDILILNVATITGTNNFTVLAAGRCINR